MFLVAVKTALVEALRDVFDGEFESDDANRPFPRRISLEYAEEAQDWPFILIQTRMNRVSWTGIDPDEDVEPDIPDPYFPIQRIRQGFFSGSCDLSVLALTSEERDRMWDTVVELFLMGRKKEAMADFYASFENQDLVGITVQEGTITPIGDTIGPGVPWNPEKLSYEATLRFQFIGFFFADFATQKLVPISTARITSYIEDAETLPDDDGHGTWSTV